MQFLIVLVIILWQILVTLGLLLQLRLLLLHSLLILPFYAIWSINLVNFDVLVIHAESACLGVDLQVVRVLHFWHLVTVGVVMAQAGGVHATDGLLGHLFVEDI